MKHQINKTQVVILGGGITGLSAALYLMQQGIDFILIERHKGTSIYPRARTIDVRTMELFRGLGLNETLREAGKALASAWGIIRGNSLVEALQNPVGKITPAQLIATQKEMKLFAENAPETVCRCTQDISEAIICTQLQEQGADLRFYHQMLSFEQFENGITVWVENRITGEQYAIAADYMIAADGANSVVRKQLNIPVSGNGSWTDLLNIYFEADLEQLVRGQEFSQFLIDTPDMTGFLLTINNSNKWAFHLRFHPENGETPAEYTEEKLISILRHMLGIPDQEIKILKVLPWQLTVIIAARMRANSVFLAGDAAHTMTPYAGKGANAGIQDVQNLAWKLAAVLKHGAGDGLLDTYHAERQQVGAYYATLSGELADKNGLINDRLMVSKAKDLMGLPDYGYESSAVKRTEGLPFTYFKGEQGTRIPHLWVNEAHTLSSIDWIKGQFVLIANGNESWQAACDQVHLQLGISVKLIILEDGVILNKWKKMTATTAWEALLIRPDDFVAAKLTADDLLEVMKSILNKSDVSQKA